ncbi:MAG: HEAT repeat domain-containing protein, partial [Planctomycetota bacterium JB042]
HGASTQAGLDALDALADIGGERASEVLAGLLDAERPELREEAAYRLALLGDMRAVPTLLDVLDTPSRSARAQDALSLLLYCDGGERGASFVQRWRDEPTLSSEAWFRRALDLPDDRGTGELPLAVLLPAIRDSRWYVRVKAIERLEERFGVSFGSPRRFASADDVERLARRWDGWLAAPRGLRGSKDGG